MKDVFITKLILEKVRNLSRIEIPLSSENRKHLIFTGKNGSGKTTILDGLAWYLNQLALTNKLVCNENVLLAERKLLKTLEKQGKPEEILKQKKEVEKYEQIVEEIKNGFTVELNCPYDEIHPSFEAGEFLIAYYTAERVFMAEIPKHVEKVELKENYSIYENPRKDFVKYLLDLKMTQALSQTGGKQEKAEGIRQWFDSFESLLRNLFENEHLKLEFDEETFRFSIKEPEKEEYDFNTLSSGVRHCGRPDDAHGKADRAEISIQYVRDCFDR